MKFLTPICLVACLLAVLPHASAETKYPGLNYVLPLSVRRGETTKITVNTNGDVKTAYRALVEGSGIVAKVFPRGPKQPAGESEVELTIAADAVIGPREIRLATKEAVTTVGRFYVTDLPVADENPKNDELAEAQAITLPVALNGRVEKPLDMDWYKFDAKAGQQATFAVRGVQLHDTIHKIGRFINHFDAMLILTDADGVELALNDDHYRADPLLSYRSTKDGTYYLCLREATYKGNAFYTYTLVGTFTPWPTHASPLAIAPGNVSPITLHGPGYDQPRAAKVAMPADASLGFPVLLRPESVEGAEPELLIWANNLPVMHESETEQGGENKPQPVTFPIGIAGQIDRAGDVDRFVFQAKKGQTYEFEVIARRLYTSLDSQLAIFDSKGKRLAINDDSKDFLGRQSKDSVLSWKAPADENYTLEVSDMMGQGGAGYAYHLVAGPAEPDFQITCNPDLAMIGPGSRTPLFVKVHRMNGFDAEVRLSVENLPPGMTASQASIPAGRDETLIVLAADASSAVDAANIRIVGKTKLKRGDEEKEITRLAIPLAEIYQAGYRIPVNTLTAAVTEPSDITVDSPVTQLSIRPGESVEIPVTIGRAEKYKGGRVTLVTDLDRFGKTLPKDIKIDSRKSQLVLTGNQTAGKIVLTADKDAKPIENIPVVVIGQVSVEFSVFVPYCTAPISLTVSP